MNNKTFNQRKEDVQRDWHLKDADNKVLGRFASEVAQLIIGKHKPTFSPNTDGGDYVVVINAAKIAVTGDHKLEDKKYYTHSGYMGGLKTKTLGDLLKTNPEEVIKSAVYGMLPKNKLRSDRILRLKIYAGEVHNHESQLGK
ncbi:MAG: large subunit ribosomal protein [Patescibacteria group bacterium]|nr:large subunit ribosomal protein [Patescibacteria group bacterium]